MGITKINFNAPWVLLDSGSFIHYDTEQPVTLTVVENDGTPINARLILKKDTEIDDPTIKFDEFDKDTLLVTIIHNGHLSNYGLMEPLKVGSFNGNELYFNFRFDLNNNSDTVKVHFTWYTGKEDKL